MRKPSEYRKRLSGLGNILIYKGFPSPAFTLVRAYAETSAVGLMKNSV
jgi:hypothetical protein